MKQNNIIFGVCIILNINICLNAIQTDDLEFNLNRKAASSALSDGFPSIAISLYRKVLNNKSYEGLTNEEKEDLLIDLSSALIANDDIIEGRKIILRNNFSEKNKSRVILRKAIISYIENNATMLKQHGEELKDLKPNPNENAWHYFILSSIEPPGNNKEELFNKAIKSTKNITQRAELHLLKLKSNIINFGGNEVLLANIKNQMDQFRGTDAEKEFIVQYILVLNSLGKVRESLKEIQNNLNKTINTKSLWRDRLLLLYSIVTPKNTENRINALTTLIREGVDFDHMLMGIHLLLKDRNQSKIIHLIIEELVKDQNHLLHEYILNLRIYLFLITDDFDNAEKYSRLLIEGYPDSVLSKDVYWTMASSVWKNKPVNYRLLANYLSKIYMHTNHIEEKSFLSLYLGDCHYLNKDYQNAISNYHNVIINSNIEEIINKAHIQIINSHLNSSKVNKAIVYSENNLSNINDSTRFLGKWNILMYMMTSGMHQMALSNIYSLYNKKINVIEQIKLLYIELVIRYNNQNYNKCHNIFKDIDNLIYDYNKTVVVNNNNLYSMALLIKAQIHFDNNQSDQSFEILNKIQSLPDSKFIAQQADLIKANYYGYINRLDKALEILIQLSDKALSDEISIIALHQASIYLERLGQDKDIMQCIKILKKLLVKHPTHEFSLNSKARIIRLYIKLGEYRSGLQFCNDTLSSNINNYNTSLNDIVFLKNSCLQSLADNNPVKLSEISDNYSELLSRYDLSNLIYYEIIYNQIIILQQLKDKESINELIYNEIIFKIFKNNNHLQIKNDCLNMISKILFLWSNILNRFGDSQSSSKGYKIIMQYKLPGHKIAESQISIINN